MSDLRINWIDEWEKKDVDLEELRRALESGDSARYSGKAFRDIGGKWKKYAKRGVSNLYLLKETEDDNDGLANAYYAYSITDGVIADEDLEQVRAVCAENLSTSEMRAVCSFCKPNEWWDSNPKRSIKAVESGQADSLKQYLAAELYPKGIVIDARSIKTSHAGELACSAIAWGVTNSIFKKGAYMSTLIHNDML